MPAISMSQVIGDISASMRIQSMRLHTGTARMDERAIDIGKAPGAWLVVLCMSGEVLPLPARRGGSEAEWVKASLTGLG